MPLFSFLKQHLYSDLRLQLTVGTSSRLSGPINTLP
jgi:hypothetical protein